MKTINRQIPDLNKMQIIRVLIGDENEVENKKNLEDIYLEKVENLEKRCEDSLIKIFSELGIHAIVKPDRYSLVYNAEYITILTLTDAFNLTRIIREIIKEVLNKNIYKLRFYMFINLLETSLMLSKIEYRFRYSYKQH